MKPHTLAYLLMATIVITIGIVAWLTNNPLALAFLWVLRDIPVIVSQSDGGEPEEEEQNKMGFV